MFQVLRLEPNQEEWRAIFSPSPGHTQEHCAIKLKTQNLRKNPKTENLQTFHPFDRTMKIIFDFDNIFLCLPKNYY